MDYDLAELASVEVVAEAAMAYADSLLTPGVPEGWKEYHLISAVTLTEEAWRLLNLQTWRIQGTLGIGAVFRDAAEQLRATVVDELRAAGRAL